MSRSKYANRFQSQDESSEDSVLGEYFNAKYRDIEEAALAVIDYLYERVYQFPDLVRSIDISCRDKSSCCFFHRKFLCDGRDCEDNRKLYNIEKRRESGRLGRKYRYQF